MAKDKVENQEALGLDALNSKVADLKAESLKCASRLQRAEGALVKAKEDVVDITSQLKAAEVELAGFVRRNLSSVIKDDTDMLLAIASLMSGAGRDDPSKRKSSAADAA